jgi:hypothetical protein
MKKPIYLMLLLALIVSACTPPQQMLNSWVNREALPAGPFSTIFVLAITQNKAAQYAVENQLGKLFNSRGKKAVKSIDIFSVGFTENEQRTKEQMADAIKKAGCDAVFIVTLLDVKTEETYQPGTTYIPPTYEGYGSFYGYYGYYNHQFPVVYEQGYYTTDKTYFLETNFYDLSTDKLLWSIQSDAYNPSSLESWFNGYSKLLLKQLKKEGLITK